MAMRNAFDAPILVIDDQPVNTRLMERILEQSGYTCVSATNDPLEGVELFAGLRPKLVVLDLMMPRLDGFGVMERIHALLEPDIFVPILVLTADNTVSTKRRALDAGATDFLTKPFDASEVALRIRNLLTLRLMHDELQQQNVILEHRVRERTQELEESRLETLEKLALAAEFRDDNTGRHTQRVARVAVEIARALGEYDATIEQLWRAAALHDVGKIGVPDHILLKPGQLTAEERLIMQRHAEIGYHILSNTRSGTLQLAAEVAWTHHERWDGLGYPRGLSGAGIPLSGRITAIADVFDALTQERPYKPAWSVERAVVEIERLAGSHFDPAVVSVFVCLPEGLLLDRI